jgi:hypothetical protein
MTFKQKYYKYKNLLLKNNVQCGGKIECININPSNTLFVPMHSVQLYETSQQIITSGLTICTAIFFSVNNINYGIHSNQVCSIADPVHNVGQIVLNKLEELERNTNLPTQIYIIYSMIPNYAELEEYCTKKGIIYNKYDFNKDTFNIVGIHNDVFINCEMSMPEIHAFPNALNLTRALHSSNKSKVGKHIQLKQEAYDIIKSHSTENKFEISAYNGIYFSISKPGVNQAITSIHENDIEKYLS